eukprot:scaffold1042_cov401-Prasinococcus_capsulatus_cf.AAC.11
MSLYTAFLAFAGVASISLVNDERRHLSAPTQSIVLPHQAISGATASSLVGLLHDVAAKPQQRQWHATFTYHVATECTSCQWAYSEVVLDVECPANFLWVLALDHVCHRQARQIQERFDVEVVGSLQPYVAQQQQ